MNVWGCGPCGAAWGKNGAAGWWGAYGWGGDATAWGKNGAAGWGGAYAWVVGSPCGEGHFACCAGAAAWGSPPCVWEALIVQHQSFHDDHNQKNANKGAVAIPGAGEFVYTPEGPGWSESSVHEFPDRYRFAICTLRNTETTKKQKDTLQKKNPLQNNQ